MYPILYKSDETDFSNRGLGGLTSATKCLVSEERNGPYELEMEYPLGGIHFKEMKEGMLLRAKPNYRSDLQLFRIYKIEKKFNKRIGVYAEHISYDLNNYPVDIVRYEIENPPSVTPGQQWNNYINSSTPANRFSLLPITDYKFTSDIDDTAAPIYVENPCSVRGLLGGQEGSLLDLYKGEFEFDNFNIIFNKNRGQDNGVTVKYGKNMTDMEQDISVENLYTHVFPYAKKTTYPVTEETDEESNTVEVATPVESFVYRTTDSDRSSRIITLYTSGGMSLEQVYGFRRVKYLDLTGVFESDYDFKESDIRQQANNYISENEEMKRPKVTLTVTFQPMSDVSSGNSRSALEKVCLCDIVRVVHPLYGIDEKLKVNKTIYNVLLERYKSIEIGDPKSNFADTVRDQFYSK